jgi:predicted SAM-dependent methyltransferase
MTYVNLGCGQRYNRDGAWLNYDFVPSSEDVIQADLRRCIPLADETATVVYHSHVLEHFDKSDGVLFLRECHRVLAPGGVLRIAVPDLEQIVRTYLASADDLRREHSLAAERHHDWLVAEIVDQCARHQSTGTCGSMLRTWPETDKTFLLNRWGGEAKRLLETQGGDFPTVNPSFMHRVVRGFKRKCMSFFLGADLIALDVGRFRLGGEPHLWMYDELSLGGALRSVGFDCFSRVTATISQINNWATFGLDTDSDGKAYKPDSLFMEAVKTK